jgi:hypothetical protein
MNVRMGRVIIVCIFILIYQSRNDLLKRGNFKKKKKNGPKTPSLPTILLPACKLVHPEELHLSARSSKVLVHSSFLL